MCRLLEKWSAACVSELRTKQQTSQDTSAAFRFRDDGASVGWAPSTSWLPEHIWSQLSAFPAGNGLLRCPLGAGLGWWNPVTCGVLPRIDAEPKPPLLVMELCTTENHWQAVSNIQLHQPAKLKLNKVKQKKQAQLSYGEAGHYFVILKWRKNAAITSSSSSIYSWAVHSLRNPCYA